MICENNQNLATQVKIFFEVARDDGEIESIWALPVKLGYQIDNIPFYAKGVACGDVVGAVPNKDGMLYFTEIVDAAGHSTVRLWFENELDVAPVRNFLRQLGCQSELDLARLVTVDIPPSTPYGHILVYLNEQESAGVFEYEEACLGQEQGMK